MKLPAEPESINAFAGKDWRYVSQTGVYFMDEMKREDQLYSPQVVVDELDMRCGDDQRFHSKDRDY